MPKLATKIVHIVSGDLTSKGLGFILTIYLTRVLGTEGFGIVTVAIAFVSYCVFFGDFGLFTIGTREVAKSPENRHFYPFDIQVSRMLLATSVFFVAWIILPYFFEDPKQIVLTRRFVIVMLVHAYLIEWYFSGTQRFKIIAISHTIQMAIYTLGAIIFIKDFSDILHLPIFYVLGYFISAVLLISLAFKDNAFAYKSSSITSYKRLFSVAFSLGFGLLFTNVIKLLPPIMIGIFMSTSEAGLYGAAFRLILIGMLLDRLFVQLFIPNLSKQWVENKERALVHLEHTSRIILSVGVIVSVFLAIGAVDFSSFLFGKDFIASTPIIISLSLFLFFTFQNSMFSHGLIAIGKDREFLKAASYGGIVATVLIVCSSIYLNSAMVGLAVAISEMIIAMICFYMFNTTSAFNYIQPFLITLILGLFVYFGSTFFSIIPAIKACIAAAILCVALVLFKILRVDDLKWLTMILTK